MEYNRHNFTDCKLGSIIIKVSMDDLYIIKSIVSQLT